ncbi:MAG: sigma 54-interacting transcriptional regulator [Planctomycetota bacterium]|jgi:Nif-specific regulatory protein
MPPTVQPRESDLRLLFAINQILVGSLEPLAVLEPVLAALVEGTHLQHAVVAKVHRRSGELRIAAAVGLTPEEHRAAEQRVDDGPISRAVSEAQPLTLPLDGDTHPLLGACTQPVPCSLLVVPIQRSGEIVGAIAGDFPSHPASELSHVSMLMSTVASMIAQAVRLRQRATEEREALRAENELLRDALKERYQPDNIVGSSKPMRAVFEQIARVARANATVLIRGESGVGKELVASAIHYSSARSDKPFVKVNCAALPATLLESELFGHEKGAFTGAVQARKGRFELADGGTLFLDEIGEFPLTTQVLLLRFLQERQFERIGSAEPRSTDVRVIAATNADLEEGVSSGQFREDLYYRLNVFPIHVPALRERPVDVLPLAEHFLEVHAAKNGLDQPVISSTARALLNSHAWPGNVRELENCMIRAMLQCEGDVIRSHHLPPTMQPAGEEPAAPGGTLAATLERVERELILDALRSTRGNRARAARLLDITERQMGLRVKRYGIDVDRLR